jgi:hypothetical protein
MNQALEQRYQTYLDSLLASGMEREAAVQLLIEAIDKDEQHVLAQADKDITTMLDGIKPETGALPETEIAAPLGGEISRETPPTPMPSAETAVKPVQQPNSQADALAQVRAQVEAA